MVSSAVNAIHLRPPGWLRWIYPGAVWKLPEPKMVFTFDDGPHPVYTPRILGILKAYNIKGYFFLSGSQAERFPELVIDIRDQGHTIGLHGYQHKDGWKTPAKVWLEDWEKGKAILDKICGFSVRIGRPPYGHIPFTLWRYLPRTYEIWMWDLLPGDYSEKVNSEALKTRILEGVRPGSILVLHENDKAGGKVCEVLGDCIEGIRAHGIQV